MDRLTIPALGFRNHGLWAMAAVVVQVAACNPGGQAEEGGNVTAVRSTGVGKWGAETELQVELDIGALEGPDEYVFGRISHIAVDTAGAMYVYDAQVPALRKYAPDGSYVHTIGGEGSGPGEYKHIEGLRTLSEGQIAAWDVGNVRINLYDPTGDVASSIRVNSGLQTARPFAVDTSNIFYVKVRAVDQIGAPTSQHGFMRITLDGTVIDTVFPPMDPPEPPKPMVIMFSHGWLDNFPITKKWTVSPHGHMVVGVNDEYRFDIVASDGSVVRVFRECQPVEFASEERTEWEALTRNVRRQMPPGRPLNYLPEIPEFKPPFRDLYVADDGRVWVHLYGAAEKVGDKSGIEDPQNPYVTWFEPAVFDVFEEDGTYLGEVRFPLRYRPVVMKGDTVWGVRDGEFNEQYVFRMRLEHSESAR